MSERSHSQAKGAREEEREENDRRGRKEVEQPAKKLLLLMLMLCGALVHAFNRRVSEVEAMQRRRRKKELQTPQLKAAKGRNRGIAQKKKKAHT